MERRKVLLIRTLGLPLATGVGVALNFTVFDNNATWLPIFVGILAVGVLPFLAGWLSPRRAGAALFPIGVLCCLAIATAIGGPISPDSDTAAFIVMLSAIYGVAAVVFLAGWVLADTFVRTRY